MTNMIDRIADLIDPEAFLDWSEYHDAFYERESFAASQAISRQNYRQEAARTKARAILALLSEPTDAMKEAGSLAVVDGSSPDFIGDTGGQTMSARLSPEEAGIVFKAMLQNADV